MFILRAMGSQGATLKDGNLGKPVLFISKKHLTKVAGLDLEVRCVYILWNFLHSIAFLWRLCTVKKIRCN